MKNKKAAIHEGVLMIFRMIMVIMIFFVVFGLSSIYYDYSINVRDIEAGILMKDVVNCIAPYGEVNLDKIPQNKDILDFCGLKVDGYINLSFYELNGNNKVLMRTIQGGDPSKDYTKAIFSSKRASSDIQKYEPGRYPKEVDTQNGILINAIKDGNKLPGRIELDVKSLVFWN